MKTTFLGQAYAARSRELAYNRCINLIAESAPQGEAKEVGTFYWSPGLEVVATGLAGGCRGLYLASDGVAYGVFGSTAYSFLGGVATAIGAMNSTDGPVSITDNGTQVAFADGVKGKYYGGGSFQDIPGAFPHDSTHVAYIDTYIIAFDAGTQSFFISGNNDVTTWSELDFASAEGAPDDIVSIIADHRELWVFGETTTEVFYNSGATDFPFQRINGAFMEHGCSAPFSVAKLDNTVFWLGSDTNGAGIIYRANGYAPQRLSTYAIEYHIAQYERTDDAIGWTYQQEGHAFYVLTFPSAGATWVYDASTSLWSERNSFASGQFVRWRAAWHAFAGDTHYVGDFETGTLYRMGLDIYTDGGETRKWLRTFRGFYDENSIIDYARCELDAEMGVGLVVGQGSDPQVMLRFSDDGGFTWSNIKTRTLGALGRFKNRAIWRRLGRSRDRMFELSGTDPVKISLLGFYVR